MCGQVCSVINLELLLALCGMFGSGLYLSCNSCTFECVSWNCFRMCSVLEPGRTEWDGSVPREWNGSIFCSVRKNSRNGTVPFFVRLGAELRNGMAQFWLSSPLCCIRVNIPPVCSRNQIKKFGSTSFVFLAIINDQILSQAKHIYDSKRKTYRCI
jgi:hypothetical protein